MKKKGTSKRTDPDEKGKGRTVMPVQIPKGKVIHEVVVGDMVHKLVMNSEGIRHDWTQLTDEGELSILDLRGEELLSAAIDQLNQFTSERNDDEALRYQTFSAWDERTFHDLEQENVAIGLVREGEDVRIRMTAGGSRYELQYLKVPWKEPTPAFTVSRLNSVGYGNVVDLLGMGYWSHESETRPWLTVVRYPDGTGSGFSPFLSDVNELINRGLALSSGKLRKFLLDLSMTSELGSLKVSRSIGRAIGGFHGSLVMDRQVPNRDQRRPLQRDRIIELFSRSTMGMEEIGSHLGMVSAYMEEIKKGLYRKLGDAEPPQLSTGRKQKVVKKSRVERYGKMSTLSLLRGALLQRQRTLGKRFSVLRNYKGSPLVPAGLDCRLDMVEIDRDQRPIFRTFDWSYYDRDEEPPKKTLPLKDLALVAGSLNKARYLAARKLFSRITRGKDQRYLDLMYLDYNLAKEGYLSMMSDFGVFMKVHRTDVPFRHVFLSSIISSIWFERNRNALVHGYNEGLSFTEHEDLLVYPKGVDTLEGLKLMLTLTSLSSATRSIIGSNGTLSLVGLESDLLNALST